MKIIWEFHHNGNVWLEWIDNGIQHGPRRLSIEAFDKLIEDHNLDFLN